MKFNIKNIPNVSGNVSITKIENIISNSIINFLKFEILVKQRAKSNIIRMKNNTKFCSIVNKTNKVPNL